MMQPTLFDLHGIERIAAWKQYRDELEHCKDPLQQTVDLWCRAPFVNSFLNPNLPETWPGPWELLLENKYDDLGLALGQLYTLQLTKRFEQSRFDILAATSSDSLSETFVVLVNNTHLLNLEYRSITLVSELKEKLKSRLIWSTE